MSRGSDCALQLQQRAVSRVVKETTSIGQGRTPLLDIHARSKRKKFLACASNCFKANSAHAELQELKGFCDRGCQEDALLGDLHFMALFIPFIALAFIAAFMGAFMALAFMVLAFMTTFDGF